MMFNGREQPERSDDDGPVEIQRVTEGLVISCTQEGETTRLHVSEYNAWRVFGMLALMLGVELPKKLAKSIKLGGARWPEEGRGVTR